MYFATRYTKIGREMSEIRMYRRYMLIITRYMYMYMSGVIHMYMGYKIHERVASENGENRTRFVW